MRSYGGLVIIAYSAAYIYKAARGCKGAGIVPSVARNLELLDRVMQHPGSSFVWGPPGVGKTYQARQAIAKSGIPGKRIYQVTLNEDWTVQELSGHYVPSEGGKWTFKYGPVTLAMMEGAVIVNELGRANGAVQDFFLSVLDGQDVRQIDLINGKRITGHKGFRVVATSNSSPEELDEAVADRFDSFINVTHPAPDLIKHLNMRMQGLGDFIYNSFDDPQEAVSPRRATSFLDLKARLGSEKDAAELAFGEKADDALMVMRGSR